LLLRFTQHDFVPTETTIGIEFGSSFVTIQEKKVKLQIWVRVVSFYTRYLVVAQAQDTAGQESFRSISRAYYRNAIGCILVFDMTRRETFTHVQSWLQDGISLRLIAVTMHGNDQIKAILVANKCDQEIKRQVSREEAIEFRLAKEFKT
jgi:Ras-related protein Rab-2A